MKFTILLGLIFLFGCTTIKTEFVEVAVPVLSCPKPPLLIRPKLYINDLTQADSKDFAKVAKYFDITLEQLLGYTKQLETVIEQYNNTSKDYKELEQDLKNINISVDSE